MTRFWFAETIQSGRKSNQLLSMSWTLILLVGFGFAAFGFAVMRNPMRLAWLAPNAGGYYQWMVLDRAKRQQLRVVGMLFFFFGLVILSSAFSGLLRFKILEIAYEGTLGLLWVSFIAAFGFGVIESIVQLVRGRGKEHFFGSFGMWRQGIELEPIAVDLAITPQMRNESRVFTVICCLLLALSFVVALVVR
jgi:hypothetical protein